MSWKEKYRKAFREGVKSAQSNGSQDDNPYPEQPITVGMAWLNGFRLWKWLEAR